MRTDHLPADAAGLLCPFSICCNELVHCLVKGCMAWTATEEVENLPVGMEPQGEGWSKKGAPTGAGGAVTHRQSWARERGYCARISR